VWRQPEPLLRAATARARREPATEYKPGTRKHITGLGHTIMAGVTADQFSDLLGGNAGHQVKIPDPMDYIP
jgi:hypothetical protein